MLFLLPATASTADEEPAPVAESPSAPDRGAAAADDDEDEDKEEDAFAAAVDSRASTSSSIGSSAAAPHRRTAYKSRCSSASSTLGSPVARIAPTASACRVLINYTRLSKVMVVQRVKQHENMETSVVITTA